MFSWQKKRKVSSSRARKTRTKSAGNSLWPTIVAVLAIVVLAIAGVSMSKGNVKDADAAVDWTYTALWNETYSWLSPNSSTFVDGKNKIYVSDGTNSQLIGSDDPALGNGTKIKPYKTLKNALSKISTTQRPAVTYKHVVIIVRGTPSINTDFQIADSVMSLQIIGADLNWNMIPHACEIKGVNTLLGTRVSPYFRMSGLVFTGADLYTRGGLLVQFDNSTFYGSKLDPQSNTNFYSNNIYGLKIYNDIGSWFMSFRNNKFDASYSKLSTLFGNSAFPDKVKVVRNDFDVSSWPNAIVLPSIDLKGKILFDNNY